MFQSELRALLNIPDADLSDMTNAEAEAWLAQYGLMTGTVGVLRMTRVNEQGFMTAQLPHGGAGLNVDNTVLVDQFRDAILSKANGIILIPYREGLPIAKTGTYFSGYLMEEETLDWNDTPFIFMLPAKTVDEANNELLKICILKPLQVGKRAHLYFPTGQTDQWGPVYAALLPVYKPMSFFARLLGLMESKGDANMTVYHNRTPVTYTIPPSEEQPPETPRDYHDIRARQRQERKHRWSWVYFGLAAGGVLILGTVIFIMRKKR